MSPLGSIPTTQRFKVAVNPMDRTVTITSAKPMELVPTTLTVPMAVLYETLAQWLMQEKARYRHDAECQARGQCGRCGAMLEPERGSPGHPIDLSGA